MKFKLDENLPQGISVMLRQGGHDARSVLDENLSGAPDETIAAVCQEERRILLTLDLDFADIRAYPPRDFFGIIVLRIGRQDRNAVFALLPRVLSLLQTEVVVGRLWIVDEHRTRIRGEP